MRKLFFVFAFLIYVGTTVAEEQQPLFTVKSLTPEFADKVAKAALLSCRKAGFQVTVAVVDRAGILQVLIRDQLAGYLTVEAAKLKAQTAASFRTNSGEIAEATFNNKELSGIRHEPGLLALAGGVVILAAGELVGAVGVAGAPQSKSDEVCAKFGVEAIQDQLDF